MQTGRHDPLALILALYLVSNGPLCQTCGAAQAKTQPSSKNPRLTLPSACPLFHCLNQVTPPFVPQGPATKHLGAPRGPGSRRCWPALQRAGPAGCLNCRRERRERGAVGQPIDLLQPATHPPARWPKAEFGVKFGRCEKSHGMLVRYVSRHIMDHRMIMRTAAIACKIESGASFKTEL